ncbi:MAG TPA: 2-oxo acid dehydrogenase subunit E2, partial [Terrimicrobiaceae bacterium]
MNVEVKVPTVGESITSGILSTWHKKDGETVNSGDLLFTLETDKVSTEVTAPESGVLRTQAAEGDEVKIDQVVAVIEPATGAAAAPPAEQAKPEPAAKAPEPAPAPVEEPSAKAAPAAPPPPPRKEEAPAPKPKIAAPDDPRTSRKKLTPLRRKIAAQLVMAQHTAAILTTFNECDMSGVMALRKEMQEEFTKKHGVKLGFMSFFVKSVVDALKAVPSINSRIDGDDLVQNQYYDIGVAVGTERGLIVPVLRNCDQKSFADIESDLIGYAGKAREGKIGLDDLQGGIFTISNGGVYGSLLSTPILNPPQSGILGMHKIQERPVAEKGQVVVR